MSAREDELRNQREHDLHQTIARLERELHRLRCEYGRVAEEADWKAEECRVLRRVILRQDEKIRALEETVERLT